MTLPADSQVHSEWSWDAAHGSMDGTCARALELGLPAVAFTEHVDHTVWALDRSHLDEDAHLLTCTSSDGLVTPGPFDAARYLEAIAECRLPVGAGEVCQRVVGTSCRTRSMSRSTSASAPKGARGSENVRRWCGSRAATMAMIMTKKKMMSMAESLRSS